MLSNRKEFLDKTAIFLFSFWLTYTLKCKKKVIYALSYNGNSNSTDPKFYVTLKVTDFQELKEYKIVDCLLEVSDIP
jgi:hypothetical protein